MVFLLSLFLLPLDLSYLLNGQKLAALALEGLRYVALAMLHSPCHPDYDPVLWDT